MKFSKFKGKKIVEREKEIQNEEERLAKAIADDVAEENKNLIQTEPYLVLTD